MKTDSSTLNVLMASLAGEANNAAVATLGPNYPNGWATLAFIKGTATPFSAPAVQGFLALGYSDPQDPTSPLIAALALGIDWSNFFKYYQYGIIPASLSSDISGTSDNSLIIDNLYNSAYLNARNSIWDSLKFLGKYPLYLCGIGLGGPLAQLAALDLRPGPKPRGPQGQFPPLDQALCFTFSVPNVSNSKLVSFYNQSVKDPDGDVATNTFWAGKTGLSVDFFPTAPNDSDAGILGNPVSIANVKLPAVDVPWLERGNTFYIEQLGGAPLTGPNIPGNMINPPAGYNQLLAYTLAKLNAEAYHQAQHPGSTGGVSGYNLEAIVNHERRPFAFIFNNVTNVVVAIRGATTWQEEQQISANSVQANWSIIPGSSVHTGISTFYDDGESSPFREALIKAIKAIGGLANKKLYLTGHSLGGAIANLAAVDYALNAQTGLSVAGLYTFGSICLGDVIFKEAFNDALGPKSYQIVRVFDNVANALLGPPANYSLLNNSVVLGGLLSKEENTYHSLNGYLQLLNPGT